MADRGTELKHTPFTQTLTSLPPLSLSFLIHSALSDAVLLPLFLSSRNLLFFSPPQKTCREERRRRKDETRRRRQEREEAEKVGRGAREARGEGSTRWEEGRKERIFLSGLKCVIKGSRINKQIYESKLRIKRGS